MRLASKTLHLKSTYAAMYVNSSLHIVGNIVLQTATELSQIQQNNISQNTKKMKSSVNAHEDQSKPGQSSRGVSRRQKYFSKVPAHASLFVKKFDFRLKSFFTVAGIEECSNCECGVGPTGSWITAQSKSRVNPQTKAQNFSSIRTEYA